MDVKSQQNSVTRLCDQTSAEKMSSVQKARYDFCFLNCFIVLLTFTSGFIHLRRISPGRTSSYQQQKVSKSQDSHHPWPATQDHWQVCPLLKHFFLSTFCLSIDRACAAQPLRCLLLMFFHCQSSCFEII